VRWQRGLRYTSSTHAFDRPELNLGLIGHPERVSGALFHFKFVDHILAKAAEETVRREHYLGADEYRAYLELGDVVLHDPEVSRRYEGPAQLERMGLMQRGTWF